MSNNAVAVHDALLCTCEQVTEPDFCSTSDSGTKRGLRRSLSAGTELKMSRAHRQKSQKLIDPSREAIEIYRDRMHRMLVDAPEFLDLDDVMRSLHATLHASSLKERSS